MKSYEEMAQNIIEAYDDYTKKRKEQKRKIIRSVTAGATLCFSFTAVMFVWNQVNNLPKIPFIAEEQSVPVTSDSTTESLTNQNTNKQENDTSKTTEYTKNFELTSPNTDDNISTNPSVAFVEDVISTISNDFTTAISGSENKPSSTITSTDKLTTPSQSVISPTDSIKPTNPTHTEENTTSNTPKPTEPSTTIKIPDVATGTTAEQIKPTNPTTETPAAEPTTKDERDECTDNHVYLKWDEMTINQQYFLAEYGDPIITYSTLEKEVSASEIGEYICSAHMTGYDWYELNYHYCNADAYKIKGDDNMTSIAIKFSDDDNYYLYSISAPNDAELDG